MHRLKALLQTALKTVLETLLLVSEQCVRPTGCLTVMLPVQT